LTSSIGTVTDFPVLHGQELFPISSFGTFEIILLPKGYVLSFPDFIAFFRYLIAEKSDEVRR